MKTKSPIRPAPRTDRNLTVKGLSDLTGASSDAIRYYTQIGLLQPKRNEVNGYRYFSIADTVRVTFIKRAKTLGFKLEEISKILQASEKGSSPCPLAREIIARRIKEHRAALRDAGALLERMEAAVRQWRGLADGVPIGHSICYLIEQATMDPR